MLIETVGNSSQGFHNSSTIGNTLYTLKKLYISATWSFYEMKRKRNYYYIPNFQINNITTHLCSKEPILTVLDRNPQNLEMERRGNILRNLAYN